MDDTTRVLVLANRTADSSQLRDALLERRDRGPIEVTLLVPAAWEAQDPHGGVEAGRRRVRSALANLRDTGLEVRCHLGDPPPGTALREAWDPERYDEVIVSTLPSRVSKWLQIDLPRRAPRITGGPVTHVEEAGGGGARQRRRRSRASGAGRRAVYAAQPRTVRHDCHEMRRISSVIASPIRGSATSRPSATTAALATTPRLTWASARAWPPWATRAGLSRRRPARVRTTAATKLPAKPIAPAAASAPSASGRCGSIRRGTDSTPATHDETKIAATTASRASRSARGERNANAMPRGTAVSASPPL